ncbi:MAG: DUF1232 domain-containing protein [Firmicutes bacterium]|nr:DUF1232 domain-containing protein [Bacillota bacterium]
MRYIGFAVLRRRLRAIPRFLKDKRVSFGKKALVVFGLVYLFLPVDLIPPVIPVFGILDDLVLWIFILHYLKDELDACEPAGGGSQKPAGYSDKDIIDVEYTVKEEEKQNNV